jgi:hypothetical protein
MTRRIVVCGMLACVIATGAFAQDYFSPFTPYKDHVLAQDDASNPCGTGAYGIASAAPTVYEGTLVVVVACKDNRLVLRRYFRPNDTWPQPPELPPASCEGFAPVIGWRCVNGGWLPPDHPLAR